MTEQPLETPEEDLLPDAVAAAWGALSYVVDARDELGIIPATRWLASTLDGEDAEMAIDACLTLASWWEDAAQDWPDDDEATNDHRRAVIRETITALAGFPATADPATAIRLEILLLEDPPQAAVVALDILDEDAAEWSVALAGVMVRALAAEAARLEAARKRTSARLAAGLSRLVNHPVLLDERIDYGMLAAAAAWVHFIRDDYAEAMRLLAVAQAHPSDDPFTLGLVAILEVVEASSRAEPIELDRTLRATREIVERSGDPNLITAHRNAADIMARSRRQRLGDPVAELATLDRDVDDPDMVELALLLDLIEQWGAQRFDADVRERLRAWRATERPPDADPGAAAFLWSACGVVATMDGDLITARTYLAKARWFRQQVGPDTPNTAYLDALLDGFEAVAQINHDPEAARQALSAAHRRQEAQGQSFLAGVTEGQLAFAALACNRPGEALVAAVRSYDRTRRHFAGLAGSSERAATLNVLSDLRATMLQAAGEVGDPRLLAEVLEFLRAQAAPTASITPGDSDLPLKSVVSPAIGAPQFLPRLPDVADAVAVAPPPAVLMPWGTLALESVIEVTDGTPARLVVPR